VKLCGGSPDAHDDGRLRPCDADRMSALLLPGESGQTATTRATREEFGPGLSAESPGPMGGPVPPPDVARRRPSACQDGNSLGWLRDTGGEPTPLLSGQHRALRPRPSIGPTPDGHPCQRLCLFADLTARSPFEQSIERALSHLFVPSRPAVGRMLGDCACAAQCGHGIGDEAVEVGKVVSHGGLPSWGESLLRRVRATRRPRCIH